MKVLQVNDETSTCHSVDWEKTQQLIHITRDDTLLLNIFLFEEYRKCCSIDHFVIGLIFRTEMGKPNSVLKFLNYANVILKLISII